MKKYDKKSRDYHISKSMFIIIIPLSALIILSSYTLGFYLGSLDKGIINPDENEILDIQFHSDFGEDCMAIGGEYFSYSSESCTIYPIAYGKSLSIKQYNDIKSFCKYYGLELRETIKNKIIVKADCWRMRMKED